MMTLQDDTAVANRSPPSCISTSDTPRFKFTPVARSEKKITRLWDRNPSTPFAARSKSHKVWKRLRTLSSTNTNGQQSGRGVRFDGEMGYDNELLTEISRSGDSNYIRGVKRLRTLNLMRERSFLETKWELELSTKKRKYPIPANVHVIETFLESPKGKQETDDLGEEPFEDNRCTPATDGDILGNSTMLEGDENSKNASESRTDRNLDVLTETPDTDVDTIEPNDDKEFSSPSEGSPDIMEEGSESEDEELEDLDCQKVLFSFRSGSVLDQDSTSAGINRTGSISTVVDEHEESESNVLENDAEVATTGTSPADGNDIKDPEIEDMVTDPESATVSTTLNLSTLAGDDAELFTEFLSRAKAKRAANCAMTPNGSTSLAESDLVTHSPTPRTRRALEQLDKNSPTPQKKQRSTKSETPLTSPPPRADTEESGCSENGPEKTGTTTCRRSNRTRTAKTTRSHAAPNVPQQIPVRRANGTEFIFLSRTEAQQIALVTRANTRRNRGNAQMPKYKLQDMAKQQGEMAEAAMSPEAGDSTASAGKPIGKKQVSWNEQHLVQYADGTDPEDDNPAVVVESKGKTGKGHSTSNTSQLPKRVSTPKPTKRVRRLGTPSSSSVISSTSGHTPVAKRTKLTPRSPKVDATASSTRSKKTLTSRANGTGQFLPMRSGRKASAVK